MNEDRFKLDIRKFLKVLLCAANSRRYRPHGAGCAIGGGPGMAA
jgi:hypothetical protein